MSASDSDAVITTAASVGCGRLRSRPGTKSRISTIDAGADQPGQLRLRAGLLGHGGARAARADRKALEQPGGEVGRPDADHLALTVDLLAADERRTTTPWRSCRRARRARCPSAPPTSRREVGQLDAGERERREPLRAGRRRATRRGRRGRTRRRRRSTARRRRARRAPWASSRCSRLDDDQPASADRRARRRRSRRRPRPRRSPRDSSMKPSPSTENPNSLGS